MPVDDPQYPVNLILTGRRCLVVGGGRVAARKIEGLVACGAVVTVVAPAFDEEVLRQPVERRARRYERGDIAGCWLVVTATDDPEVNRAVADDAESAGIWVNSADDPTNCSFTLPAVVRQGPITVAVGTGGTSPALASWLRRRLEAEVGPEYVTLAELLAAERDRLRGDGVPTEGLAWQTALDSGMLDLIRAGKVQEAKERLQACLSSS